MEYGGGPISGTPYAGIDISSSDYFIGIDLELIIPVSFNFFGDIGDVVFIPPEVDLGDPVNIAERRSPCELYDN